MPDELGRGQMYIGINTARSSEVTLRWLRAQIFLVLHTAGLGTILPLVLVPPPYAQYLLILTASFMGVGLGVIWLSATRRAEDWITFWNRRLRLLETLDETHPPLEVYSSDRFQELDQRRWTFHRILGLLAYLSIVMWLCIGIAVVVRTYYNI
ncbi:MAG TPA: hypothetical protein VD928_00585 [Candidatus Paceibacterota bacterium]|nr:hypothetical protein [Candidatus Paceibacterota bacterium]